MVAYLPKIRNLEFYSDKNLLQFNDVLQTFDESIKGRLKKVFYKKKIKELRKNVYQVEINTKESILKEYINYLPKCSTEVIASFFKDIKRLSDESGIEVKEQLFNCKELFDGKKIESETINEFFKSINELLQTS